MAGADVERWAVLIAEVRQAEAPEVSPALTALCELARETGARTLQRFSMLGEAEREDIVQQKLGAELGQIVAAANPRKLFITMILNAAIDAQRRHETAGRHRAELARAMAGQPGGEDAAARDETLDMHACLATFSPRDQRILRAVAAGEDREAVAAAFDTSRANVDQVISRARKRWRQWQ